MDIPAYLELYHRVWSDFRELWRQANFFWTLFDAANLPTSTISRMRDKQLQPLVLSAVRG